MYINYYINQISSKKSAGGAPCWSSARPPASCCGNWAPSGTARARLRRGRMAGVKPGDTTSCWLKMMGKTLENEILGKKHGKYPEE